jgi:hypothetical protein
MGFVPEIRGEQTGWWRLYQDKVKDRLGEVFDKKRLNPEGSVPR